MKFFEDLCCMKYLLRLGPNWEIQATSSFCKLRYVLTVIKSYEVFQLLLAHMLAAPKKRGEDDLQV